MVVMCSTNMLNIEEPEAESFEADVAIIGGGVSGLITAISCANAFEGLRIKVSYAFDYFPLF